MHATKRKLLSKFLRAQWIFLLMQWSPSAAVLSAQAGDSFPPDPPALEALIAEALERSPAVARARHQAAAAETRAPQVRALPDPVASVRLFILPPETRVGPQRLNISLAQKLPWFGKLKLREQAALYGAAISRTRIEKERLDVLAECRRLFYELAFLAERENILLAEREALVRFEEVARARYSIGSGKQQEILRIQAQITRTDTRLLEITERRIHLTATLNALRDRPAGTQLTASTLNMPRLPQLDVSVPSGEVLRDIAQTSRPELLAAKIEIARRETLIELAEKQSRPDLTAGFSYTLVEDRDDFAARLNPPSGNGRDIFALSASINLPIRREKLAAQLEEAHAERRAAEEEQRRIESEIERHIGDLVARMPLLQEHAHLLDGVLRIQAQEALHSAEAAYTAGKIDAVDLLDAEVVLFEVRTAAARTRTDYAVAQAALQRAIGHLPASLSREFSHE